MEGLSIAEISAQLQINPSAAKKRLAKAGIKPKGYVGPTAIYDPSVVELIRNVPGKGRPPKKPPVEPASGNPEK